MRFPGVSLASFALSGSLVLELAVTSPSHQPERSGQFKHIRQIIPVISNVVDRSGVAVHFGLPVA